MISGNRTRRAAWALAASLSVMTAAGLSLPARAQDSTAEEIRLRKLEAEVRDLQHHAPAGTVQPTGASASEAGLPATTPMTDLLTRMDALEGQVARLTAQNEEMANRQHQIEAKLVAAAPAPPTPPVSPPLATSSPVATAAPAPAAAPVVAKSATASNLSAMTNGSSERAVEDRPGGPARPSAQRVAAVKAVIKPQTGDAALDEYSYGFRLYTAKFYPEAAQQLKIYIDKYPKDSHISYARNLLGRAYLDDGKPRDAAPWFLLNYKNDPTGPRAADSLLNLAEAMRQSGYDSRACIALDEFAATYAPDAKGRLREQYAKTRSGLTCN